MTHGHELKGRIAGGNVPGGGGQRRKFWENGNSIINKIYLEKSSVWVSSIFSLSID